MSGARGRRFGAEHMTTGAAGCLVKHRAHFLVAPCIAAPLLPPNGPVAFITFVLTFPEHCLKRHRGWFVCQFNMFAAALPKLDFQQRAFTNLRLSSILSPSNSWFGRTINFTRRCFTFGIFMIDDQ
ncbi:hypothetical protein E2C01_087053 [Portunus trituberculatus]|uniref:Uncharacterized protein n=1 Tax=Portunus trituberculatus TaxID=210409 RepID=A0A5B7JBD2_PORTR|nr:hypothetical protein [Portunus trituberculatus]